MLNDHRGISVIYKSNGNEYFNVHCRRILGSGAIVTSMALFSDMEAIDNNKTYARVEVVIGKSLMQKQRVLEWIYATHENFRKIYMRYIDKVEFEKEFENYLKLLKD